MHQSAAEHATDALKPSTRLTPVAVCVQDQMRPQHMLQLAPELRVVAVALNAILVEDARSYGWFSAPVDAEKLGLTDYHEVCICLSVGIYTLVSMYC